MAFTYDPNLLGQVDTEGNRTPDAMRTIVRMLIGDTDSTDPLIQDEEIDYLVALWYPKEGTVEFVASVVADTIGNRYAREASYSADGVSISLGPVAEQFRALAAALRQQHRTLLTGGGPDVGGITPGEETATNIKPFDFGTGMHDNIEAGQQAYGGRGAYAYIAEENPSV